MILMRIRAARGGRCKEPGRSGGQNYPGPDDVIKYSTKATKGRNGSADAVTPKRAFQTTLEARLADWNATLAYLRYLAITAPGGPQPKHAMVIELLRHRHDAAHTHLEEFKREDNWEDLKPALERQWEALGNDFDHSLRWFRQGSVDSVQAPMKRNPERRQQAH